MQRLAGIPASPGIAEGPCWPYRPATAAVVRTTARDPAAELQRLDSALARARQQLAQLEREAAAAVGEQQAGIFRAQALMLDDPALLASVRTAVLEAALNIEAAWADAVQAYAAQLAALSDEYFRARAADVHDVGQRVLRALLNLPEPVPFDLSRPCIVVARELAPSDTARFDPRLLLGLCTAEGTATSHTAILAKALGIPAVVGLGEAVLKVPPGTLLVVDGDSGEVVVEPDAAARAALRQRQAQAALSAQQQAAAAHQPAITPDGHQVEVLANIGSAGEARAALAAGAEGVGLLRTEFLFHDRDAPPDEAEQTAAYRAVLEAMGARPVIIRTLDVGGDKAPPYLNLEHESNPFLGWRAIRLCLERPAFFKVQLRALLRAGQGHDLRLMFPMIASLEEIRHAKALLAEAADELRGDGLPVASGLPVGMMVEIPSAAVLADLFAREVDFFSVGTNDLTQYTLAADRTNPKTAHLGDACHPAVLRLVRQVIEAGHQAGRRTGVCGELAGDPEAIPVLLGLGLDEFSMAPASIARAKAIIRSWPLAQARTVAHEALTLGTAADVRRLVRAQAAALGLTSAAPA